MSDLGLIIQVIRKTSSLEKLTIILFDNNVWIWE